MGMPSRSLKAAIDLRERRTAGFWPVMRPSSSMAASSSLMFWVASPTPMFTTTFLSRGTAITLGYSRSFISAGHDLLDVRLLDPRAHRSFASPLVQHRVGALSSTLARGRCATFLPSASSL